MQFYEVQGDVPVPAKYKRVSYTELFPTLKVGDSFLAPRSQQTNILVAARDYRKARTKPRFRLATRLQNDSAIRVWRVS